MSSYKDKYIKYKSKYLKLRTQIGGNPLDEFKKKITYSSTHCIDPTDIFHQHKGECWNDSIQMLLCFSDEIKQSVQNKLFNLTPEEIINMAYLESRNKFLAPIYRRNDEEEEEKNEEHHLSVIKFEKRLIKYLTLLQNRLCLHMTNENPDREIPQCKHIDTYTDVCPLKETYGRFLVREKQEIEIEPTKYELKRQLSEITSIGSAMKGLKLINKKTKINNHVATTIEMIPIINILSFSLLDENNVLTTKIVGVSELLSDDIDNSIAMIVRTPGHATSFFICDGHQIYYNDNVDKEIMSWKKLLNEYIDYKDTHKLILHWEFGKCVIIFKEKYGDGYIVFDMDVNIIENGYNINRFINWQYGVVFELIIIRKENLESKTDDEIYEKLEEQFVLASIFNCSRAHIKDLNIIINGQNINEILADINTDECKKINFNSEYNKKIYNKVLSIIDSSVINQSIKDELLKIKSRKIKFKNNYNCNNYDSIKTLIDNGVNFSGGYDSLFYLIVNKPSLTNIDYKIMELLLKSGQDINQNDVLDVAIRNKNLDLLKFLIKNGADVNRYEEDNNLLFYLTGKININEHSFLGDVAKNDFNYHAIQLLINSGANLSSKYGGKTLLETAIYNNKLLEIFLKAGIDVNEKFEGGYYPLIKLAMHWSGEGTIQIMRLLINSGAKLNIKSDDLGYSLLELIVANKNINALQMLIEKGIDINEPFHNGEYPIVNLLNNLSHDKFYKEAVILLINSGVNMILPDNNLLKLAIDAKDPEIIQLLITKGIDINLPIDGENNALFYIINSSSFSKENISILNILLNSGANVNEINSDGETPLLRVISANTSVEGKIKVINLLLKAGANIRTKNNFHEDIFDLTRRIPKIKAFLDDYISKK
jgi:ankyrin repeat protein